MRRRDFLGAAPFLKALPGWRFEFPRDHFAHPAFRTEWWYYTGNVFAGQQPFGFELTFFRQALAEAAASKSVWSVRDAWMAHLALTDVQGKRFYHAERLNRTGPGLAGVDAERQRIWNGNWSCTLLPQWHELRAVDPRFGLELKLTPRKAPVIHGRDGVSQKGPRPGQASHYLSFTRLATAGRISLGGKSYEVAGSAWMDHEIFSSELDAALQGWDWFSVQLDNGCELMLYRLRLKGGATSEYSAGTFVDEQGRTTHLDSKQFRLQPGRRWKDYPVEWELEAPSLGIRLQAAPRLDDQELLSATKLTPSYWEGAMTFRGTHSGFGYLEMTGYDTAVRLLRSEAVRK
jgi:predicted secreted hydrolase